MIIPLKRVLNTLTIAACILVLMMGNHLYFVYTKKSSDRQETQIKRVDNDTVKTVSKEDFFVTG